jgi:hypothetical protein
MMIPTSPANPDALLRRKEAAEALTRAGFPTSPATLATMATRSGGPPFYVFNKTALYKWGDLLTWATARAVHRGGIPGGTTQPRQAA